MAEIPAKVERHPNPSTTNPSLVRLVGRMRRGAGLLGQRGNLQLPMRRVFEDFGRLLGGAGVELDQEVDDDLLVVVLVEADVGEELAHAGVAEGTVGEELDRLRAGA